MSLSKHISDRLKGLGVVSEAMEKEVVITLDGVVTRIRLEEGTDGTYDNYRRARRSVFDVTDLAYTLNATVEIPLTRLDPDVYRDTDEMTFVDEQGNSVSIHRASLYYMLAHFDSEDYKRYFESIVRLRLTRSQVKYARSMNILFRSPVTATYVSKGRKAPINLKTIAFQRVRSCLMKLAIERHTCYEIYRLRPVRPVAKLDSPKMSDWKIPRAVYEPNLVSYYKVARSSPFPSQSFLAYYHVLEYYFLRVAEDSLHHQLRTYLNRTDFKVNPDGLDRVISLIRRHGSTDDETDMLRKVLQKFISEEDFIAHVTSLEITAKKKLYTQRRAVFGEQTEISLKEGHALSNAAKALKHVRNAIVHSSDRYKREECHIPLTDSEDVIGEFIPLVKYFAEHVLYGTATTPDV
jgi:hypothetical protein